MGYPEIHSFFTCQIYSCCEHGFNSLPPFLKLCLEHLVIFSYCVNIRVRRVVDLNIVCLFTLVFMACNVCNCSKMISLHPEIFY